jgi:hypothetical protein
MDLSQLSSLGKVGGVPGIALGAAVSGVASHAVLCRLWRPRRGSVAGHPADPSTPGCARAMWRCEGRRHGISAPGEWGEAC